MNIDNTTLELFSPFNRNVGNPYQSPIRTRKDFEDFIIRNNGINDCSASLYADNGTIDKVWFDFDGEGAIDEAKKLYDYLKSFDAKVIPIISGKKGIHLHLLVKSNLSVDEHETRVQLMDTCQSIIANGLGLEDWKQPTTLDWQKVGAVKTTCRIPNTLRPPGNTTWCSYLPENWSSISNVQVWDYAKSPQFFSYGGKVLDLERFNDNSSRNLKIPVKKKILYGASRQAQTGFVSYELPDELQEFLEPITRRCIHTSMFTKNPNNHIRVAMTIDFLQNGMSPDTIMEIISRLDWNNYNENVTREKVQYISDRFFNNDINPYSCTKIHTILQLPRSFCYD